MFISSYPKFSKAQVTQGAVKPFTNPSVKTDLL